MSTALITVDDLAEAMLSSRPPAVLDVRWQLGRDDGREQYAQGHLPGAVYVDLDTELAAPADPALGRHPLPDLADLQSAAREWGVDALAPVVVYDDNGGMSAARAWWLLRWGGVADVKILDGGLGAWREAGMRLSQGDARPRTGTVILTGDGLPTVDIDQVAATDALLLDARAGERYRGETEPVDPRPGHIPGAVSAPTADNLVDGRFRSAEDLRARFGGLGVDGEREVIVYCGSGVTAAHQIAALEHAGLTATLYPGSYSQWSSDPAKEVDL
ncbi:sulfurtransferase [Gordonia humi]|uniref:Thiosulfate/3-mercaptopyruvate sulfurtransferase n=1 Tax=Gordonia humi TaxID=686429 RepID=A0A840ETM1_9ACTN|nr:sulfurtransferase [Gordonia humi]MBB4133623.1 thiosulfate/3-mercaptopyruvate sulfurtransferase [Gordonia humi]